VFSRELDGEELARATAWAEPYEGDVFRALSECPRVNWLSALASALGEDLAVDLWKFDVENTPERVEYLTEMPEYDGTAEGRRLYEEAIRRMPSPSFDAYQRAIEKLRNALDLEALTMRAASLPLDESEDEREERILAAALEDSHALLRDDLDDATFAALWGSVGGRTFRRVSRVGAERHIRDCRGLVLKRKWQSSS
jgi:hypothetical protein